jgi:hypothetical protein
MAPYLRLLALAFLALGLSGCIPAMLSPEGHAKRVYKQMSGLQKVLLKYEAEHGHLPQGNYTTAEKALIKEGYLKRYPQADPSLFGPEGGEYQFHPNWDKMDEGSAVDSILVLSGLKDDFCKLYNNLYSSNNSGFTIYDWEANGKRYPATTIGKNMRIYAIKYETATQDFCWIEWVISYY